MAEAVDLLDRVRGCTFDDFLLTPQLGIVPSRDPSLIDLGTRFTTQIALKRPFVSANMDTITRAAMAVALAEEGGIGVIDRGFRSGDIAPQIAEVTAVKRTQHGIIADPHTIGVNDTVADALRLMDRTGVGTLVVTTLLYVLIPKGLFPDQDTGLIQGVSELIKRIAFLQGLIDDPTKKKQAKSAEEELADSIRATTAGAAR